MNSGIMYTVTIAALGIIWFEWPSLRKQPKKDRLVFALLLLVGWTLFTMDLPRMPGPISFLNYLFKPLSEILNK